MAPRSYEVITKRAEQAAARATPDYLANKRAALSAAQSAIRAARRVLDPLLLIIVSPRSGGGVSKELALERFQDALQQRYSAEMFKRMRKEMEKTVKKGMAE